MAWVLSGLAVWILIPKWEVRGQFGDMFGAINALFSGVAFAGVVYTVFLQRRELGLQREELEQTREELRRAAEAQERSHLALAEQAKALELSARFTSISSLIQAYAERVRFLESYATQDRYKIEKYQKRIEQLAEEIESILDENGMRKQAPNSSASPGG